LNATTDQASKIFVSDLGANGLQFKREKKLPFDTAEVAGKSVSFDGEWSKAKMSEADYTRTFTATDEQYAQMLQALIAVLKKPS
jgi:hypothetical protein